MTKYEHVGKKILWAQDTELTIYTLGFSKFMCKYLNLKTEIWKSSVLPNTEVTENDNDVVSDGGVRGGLQFPGQGCHTLLSQVCIL